MILIPTNGRQEACCYRKCRNGFFFSEIIFFLNLTYNYVIIFPLFYELKAMSFIIAYLICASTLALEVAALQQSRIL